MEQSVSTVSGTDMEEKFLDKYRGLFDLKALDPMQSPLALAYIGDCIYDLVVREYVLSHFPGSVNRMNAEKKKLVCAAAQAEIMGYLIGQNVLNEEEMSIYRRGRNHKNESHSKNSSIVDYRRATGFEALVGYLYAKEDFDRMLEIMSMGVMHLREMDEKE